MIDLLSPNLWYRDREKVYSKETKFIQRVHVPYSDFLQFYVFCGIDCT